MQFNEGASVYTAAGDEVGRIDRVVVDPKTGEVTHLVVSKGLIFTEDKVLPIDLVASTAEDRVTLKREVADLDNLPDFEEQYYVGLNEYEVNRLAYPAYYPSPLYWYPAYGTLGTGYAGYPWGMSTTETVRNIPEGTIPLEEGAKVVSADGEHVGDVERVFADEDSDQVTHFLISKGLLTKEKKLVPSHWVERVEEDEVYLAVGSGMVDRLREFKE